jgi:hypothetical protein
MGVVMPGSRLEHINRNESNTGLKYRRKSAFRNKHTNIIAIIPPHRHDLQDSSCVNKEIQVFIRKLHKLTKDMHHVSVIDTNLTRNDFTRHRLHTKSASKEKVARS